MSTTAQHPRASEALRAHRDAALEIIRRRGMENPRIFGSVARGTDDPDSDIDLLVKVPAGRAWEFLGLATELSELLSVHVDVVSEGGLKPKHAGILADARPL